jgi:hypothetical protein
LPIHNNEENSAAKARLITALGRGRLIGMTGAGLSCWAGYPLWEGALDHLAAFATHVTGNVQKVADPVVENQDDTLHRAQRLGHLVGEEEFAAFLGKEFGPNGKAPPNILRHFALLPLRHVLTFNFDTSCETAHQDTAVEFRSLSIGNADDLVGFFERWMIRIVSRPSSIFTADSTTHWKMSCSPKIDTVWKFGLRSRTVLICFEGKRREELWTCQRFARRSASRVQFEWNTFAGKGALPSPACHT